MTILAANEVLGGVSSFSFTEDFTHFFCGTSQVNNKFKYINKTIN